MSVNVNDDKDDTDVIVPAYFNKLAERGYEAFYNLDTIRDCPFTASSPGYLWWRNGWCKGFREFIREGNHATRETPESEGTSSDSTEGVVGT